MDYSNRNGNQAGLGKVVKAKITNGEWKVGTVSHVNEELVTVRCNVTNENPDGLLFSVKPEKIIILIP